MRTKKFYNISDSYKTYKNISDRPIDKKSFIRIVNGFMLFMCYKLFQIGKINLPTRLGTIEIVGRKIKPIVEEDGTIKGLNVNWKETRELWNSDPIAAEEKRKIYHFNEESEGLNYKFFWSKNRVLVPNKNFYNLKMTRTNKRQLAKIIKNEKVEYRITN